MAKQRIGITSGEIASLEDPWAPPVQGQARTYIEAILRGGGAPFMIPIIQDREALRSLYDMADGLLFAGGNDIDPGLYGQKAYPETKDVLVTRDDCEMQLMEWADEDRKPMLCICRGMQLLNVHRGGDLYQHIADDLPQAEDHMLSTSLKDGQHIAHVLKLQPGSMLANILGTTEIGVNAHHHQGVKRLGKGLQVEAKADDDVDEVVVDPDAKYLVGFQCHPESLPMLSKIFSAFVEATEK